MKESTKIEFRPRRIGQIRDFTEIVQILFPGNRNQQHAAACVLLELKWANGIVPNLAHLESRHRISRRTLQRARAKLARLGIIEHVSRLDARYQGQEGWRLSSRFGAALRNLADEVDHWREDLRPGEKGKESLLASLL